MIAEAAYYFAQKRGFEGEYALDDWLSAERQVRQTISPLPEPDMNQTVGQKQPKANERTRKDSPVESGSGSPVHPTSRFEKFAASQAAGDGIQGDVRKPDKTVEEKIGANMADRK
jgi:Protein of unknown function (DUF2934)